LRVVDDEHFVWSFLRLQTQTQLFLNYGENGRAITGDEGSFHFVRRGAELYGEVEDAVNAVAVEHGTVHPREGGEIYSKFGH
jgi:hypothetical protein